MSEVAMNKITAKIAEPAKVRFSEVQEGQWFWRYSRADKFPMMKADGRRYVSPATGFVTGPEGGADFWVELCPVGTVITIEVGTRER